MGGNDGIGITEKDGSYLSREAAGTNEAIARCLAGIHSGQYLGAIKIAMRRLSWIRSMLWTDATVASLRNEWVR